MSRSEVKVPRKREVDWPGFLSQHDLHVKKLPTGWKDAPPFGISRQLRTCAARAARTCATTIALGACHGCCTTQWVRIRSLAGKPCRIKTDMATPVCEINGRNTAISQRMVITKERIYLMGDKKSKKDKAKADRQKGAKQAKETKRKQDRQQPRTA